MGSEPKNLKLTQLALKHQPRTTSDRQALKLSTTQIVKQLDKPHWTVAQWPHIQYPDILESSFHDCRAT